MKKIALLSFGVIGLTLFSFKSFEGERAQLLKDGNYYVPSGIVSENDSKVLGDMTLATAKTTKVVHQTIWDHETSLAKTTKAIHETIWVHEDKKALAGPNDKQLYVRVQSIMKSYL